MQHRRLVPAAALAAASIVSGVALGTPNQNLPPRESQGSVIYRSGGIGEDEAAAMRRAANDYPLALEFAERIGPKNAFLADVEVTIKDERGNTRLHAFADGPFLLAKLPAGRYTVTAADNGDAQTRHVTLASGKQERLFFDWAR